MLEQFQEMLQTVVGGFIGTIPIPTISTILDILLVALIFYGVLRLFQGTQAVSLLRGILVVALVAIVAASRLTAFSWLVRNALPMILVAIPVIFQPELRRALERLGRTGALIGRTMPETLTQQLLHEIILTVETLARQQTGALIVLEGDTGLEEYIESGVRIDAKASARLLETIFFPGTALHDGAVIIRGNQVVAAGCLLPLTARTLADPSLGTRHRAAAGITEQNDALAIVVSEETGIVSMARASRLVRDWTASDCVSRSRRSIGRGGSSAAGHDMRRWLSNLGAAGLALLLAVTVWVIAVQEEYPSDWVSEPIALSRVGLPENLNVFGEVAGQVRIEARASKQRWRDLQARDFTAWVDLAGLPAGETDVRVQVKSPDPSVQVLSIDPQRVRVRLEEKRAKTVPVKVTIVDNAAFGYDWLTPVVTPTHVLVTGPMPLVDQVQSVAVEIYLRGARGCRAHRASRRKTRWASHRPASR